MPAYDLYPAFKEPGVAKGYAVAARLHFLQRQVRQDTQRCSSKHAGVPAI